MNISQQQQQQQPGASSGGGQVASFHAASLYVGDLAPDISENTLFEIFNQVGPVASIRVCRDTVTRRSLGYAYVNFHVTADAERALDTMNFSMIKDRPCRIMWSQRDPSLRRSGIGNVFIKNLDKSVDNKALYDTFSLFGNILSCKVSTDEMGQSKGYGYIHYETAEAASEAISKIDGMLIGGTQVHVAHFANRSERAGAVDWTNVYVKNLPSNWDEAKLKETFSKFGEVTSCTLSMAEQHLRRNAPAKTTATTNDKEDAFASDKEGGGQKREGRTAAAEDKKDAAESPANDSMETSTSEDAAADTATPATAATENEADESSDTPQTKSRCFGFVNFAEHSSALQALEEMNGKLVGEGDKARELVVCRAQNRAERQRELQQKYETMKMERINKYQGVNLYLKNLDEALIDDDVREAFSQFGTVTSARVMKDPETTQSRGFGFVCFSAPEEATKAVQEMNGKMLKSKPVYVALAQRKEVRRAQLEAQYQQRMPPRGPIGVQPSMFGMPYMIGQPAMPQQPRAGYPMMPQMMPRGTHRAPMPYAGRGPYPMPAYPGMATMPGMPHSRRQSGGSPASTAGRRQPFPAGRGVQRAGAQPAGGRGMNSAAGGAAGAGGGGFKYTGQVRNQPGMLPGGMQSAQQMPVPTPGESLTAQALAAASPEAQKNMIGERLYPLIHDAQPKLAGKITGMLLEMDNGELLHLLESPDALSSKIYEACGVLETHQKATATAAE